MKIIVPKNLCQTNEVTRKEDFKILNLTFLFGNEGVNGIHKLMV